LIDKDSLKVVFAVSYKNIIEIGIFGAGKNFTIGSSNILELKFVSSIEKYKEYIISKWQSLHSDKVEDPSNHLQTVHLKFNQGEQQAIDF
jgi:hypothetical protein